MKKTQTSFFFIDCKKKPVVCIKCLQKSINNVTSDKNGFPCPCCNKVYHVAVGKDIYKKAYEYSNSDEYANQCIRDTILLKKNFHLIPLFSRISVYGIDFIDYPPLIQNIFSFYNDNMIKENFLRRKQFFSIINCWLQFLNDNKKKYPQSYIDERIKTIRFLFPSFDFDLNTIDCNNYIYDNREMLSSFYNNLKQQHQLTYY